MLVPTADEKVRQLHKIMPEDMVHVANVQTARASERLVLARAEKYLRRVITEAGIEGTSVAASGRWSAVEVDAHCLLWSYGVVPPKGHNFNLRRMREKTPVLRHKNLY
jgi:hypothetical protein